MAELPLKKAICRAFVLVQREVEAGGSRRRRKFRPVGGDFQGMRIYRPI
jgi:hypothetical protein